MSKVNIAFIQKMFKQKLAKNSFIQYTTFKQLDTQVNSLISGMNIVINFGIFKTKVFPKSIPRLVEKLKKVKIKVKKLKKI